MGQYFKSVNLDKREVVCPWCLNGGAKLFEWCANRYGAIFSLLLRKSSGSGGGDYNGPSCQIIDLNKTPVDLDSLVREGVAREGIPAFIPESSIVGRWAGDRVVLIGDYDESQLWDELHNYTNITKQLVVEWNDFLRYDEYKLEYRNCGCLSPLLSSPTVS